MQSFIGKQFRRPDGFLGRVISYIMKKGNSFAYDKLIPELEIKQNDRILEIGYGHGLGVDRIASGFDCFVTGIDFSELMFKEAQKRNKQHINNKKVELYYGDFLNYELGADKYDKIFCINVIYFWDKLEKPFSKIKSNLRNGGIFCMYMAHRDYLNKVKFTPDDIFNKYTIEQVIEELKLTGFKEVNYTYDNGYLIKCKN
jgi:SAM-dependent methyltransferase